MSQPIKVDLFNCTCGRLPFFWCCQPFSFEVVFHFIFLRQQKISTHADGRGGHRQLFADGSKDPHWHRPKFLWLSSFFLFFALYFSPRRGWRRNFMKISRFFLFLMFFYQVLKWEYFITLWTLKCIPKWVMESLNF
jgi:hypothetical protein